MHRNLFARELVAVIQEECPDALKIVAMSNFGFVSVEVVAEHILLGDTKITHLSQNINMQKIFF